MSNPADITAGYDGEKPEESQPIDSLRWTLEQPEYFWSTKIMGQLKCDGISRGVIYFQNEEEFQWLKTKIEHSSEKSIEK